MIMPARVWLVAFSIICISSFGQTADLPDIIITTAEYLAADETDPETATIFIERLLELAENKVKINSANESELSRLFFLTEFQVRVLIDYIMTNGSIATPYEIAYIPGFDTSLAMMMEPFIAFDKVELTGNAPVYVNQSLMSNAIYKKGSDTLRPVLSAIKLLTKYKIEAGRFSAGLTVEKDGGEQSFINTRKVPDFLSAYCIYEGTGIIRNIIIGDFSVRFGQGTNIYSGIGSLSSLASSDFMTGKNEIRQYSSTDENNYFRGIATSLNLGFADLFIYYSRNLIDASLNYSEDSVAASINNFYRTGLHSTPSSLSKKDVITEISYGTNLSFNLKNFRGGITWSENRYSLPVISGSDEPKDINSFTGKSNSLLSADYKWLYKNFIMYGEYSSNTGNGYAYLQGIKLKPDNRLTINILFRHFDKKFVSFHGISSVGSGSNNETGLRANIIYEAAKNLFLSGGADFDWHHWLKYRCDAPSYGKKYEIKVAYYPSDGFSIEAYYNLNSYMLNEESDNHINKPVVRNNRSLKTIIKYSPGPQINLGTRMEYKALSMRGEQGMILSQDFNYTFNRVPLRLWLRWSLFDTDSYDSRIYIYENDLVNSFNIPALFDRGTRSYIMLAWKIKTGSELRFKYGITTTNMASGIVTDREEFKFQLRVLL
jgi:hypothetical protein